jgi:hypothetical protein
MSMRATRTLAAAFVAAAFLLTGCQDAEPAAVEESPTATAEPTETEPAESETEEPSPEPSPEPERTVVEVTIDGDTVQPNGARVEAEVGEPISLQITSDRAGELHVHSTPEQELAFEKGTSEVRLTIDQPGVVHVEDHHSGFVIVQLEVS